MHSLTDTIAAQCDELKALLQASVLAERAASDALFASNNCLLREGMERDALLKALKALVDEINAGMSAGSAYVRIKTSTLIRAEHAIHQVQGEPPSAG